MCPEIVNDVRSFRDSLQPKYQNLSRISREIVFLLKHKPNLDHYHVDDSRRMPGGTTPQALSAGWSELTHPSLKLWVWIMGRSN